MVHVKIILFGKKLYRNIHAIRPIQTLRVTQLRPDILCAPLSGKMLYSDKKKKLDLDNSIGSREKELFCSGKHGIFSLNWISKKQRLILMKVCSNRFFTNPKPCFYVLKLLKA